MAMQIYERRTQILLDDESDRLADWFEMLLDSVEQDKSMEEYIMASNTFLNTERIKGFIRAIKGIEKEARAEY
ncbi:MAG: hypothetical protein JJE17_05960 [Peptostreptococcaceae bacterium]|nr:hypothetical protein [Peptostreptococcaceae bacterium]